MDLTQGENFKSPETILKSGIKNAKVSSNSKFLWDYVKYFYVFSSGGRGCGKIRLPHCITNTALKTQVLEISSLLIIYLHVSERKFEQFSGQLLLKLFLRLKFFQAVL